MNKIFQANRENPLPRSANIVSQAYNSMGYDANRMGLAGGNTFSAPPKFYSPLHTPSNWQIPQKRQEVYVWCRFFATMEPKVAAALDFYSQFPTCTGYDNVCEDAVINEYYNEIKRTLKIEQWLETIAYEYYCLGDVFIFLSINCPICGGSGTDANGTVCTHKGGTFSGLTILNPDWVEVRQVSNVDYELIYMIPDENLINLIMRKEPREIYDRIPEAFKEQILLNKPILLNPLCTTHLAHGRFNYMPYGKSIIYRLFSTLAYKDKLRQAQWVVADRHILPIRIVKVGSDTFPANQNDIQSISQQVYNAVNDPNFTLITHHALDYDFVGAGGKVLQLSKEYDMITEEILDGLMINKSLLNSEGPSYSNASIGIEAMNKRLNSLRNKLSNWIEEKIYRPIALMQGFVKKNESGQLVPLYPKVKWKDLNLRDDSSKKNLMMSLTEKGYMSVQSLLEYLNIDYDTEIERIRAEKVLNQVYGIGGDEEGGNLGGGGGLDLGGGGGGGDLGGLLGGGGGGGEGSGTMDFGENGSSGPDLGTPARDTSPDLTAPESKPMTANNKSEWLTLYDSLPLNLKVPSVRKGNRFNTILQKIEEEKRNEQNLQKNLVEQKTKVEELKQKEEENKEEVQPIYEKFTKPEWKLFNGLKECISKKIIKEPLAIQYPIENTRMKIDFAFIRIKLAIEVDGEHHTMLSQIISDKRKNGILNKHGWTVLRFSERQVKESIEDVLKIIIEKMNELRKNLSSKKKEK